MTIIRFLYPRYAAQQDSWDRTLDTVVR